MLPFGSSQFLGHSDFMQRRLRLKTFSRISYLIHWIVSVIKHHHCKWSNKLCHAFCCKKRTQLHSKSYIEPRHTLPDPYKWVVELRINRLQVFEDQLLVQHAFIERQREACVDKLAVKKCLHKERKHFYFMLFLPRLAQCFPTDWQGNCGGDHSSRGGHGGINTWIVSTGYFFISIIYLIDSKTSFMYISCPFLLFSFPQTPRLL